MYRREHFGVIWVSEEVDELAALSTLGLGFTTYKRWSTDLIECCESYWSDWLQADPPTARDWMRDERLYEFLGDCLGDHAIYYAGRGSGRYGLLVFYFEHDHDRVMFELEFR